MPLPGADGKERSAADYQALQDEYNAGDAPNLRVFAQQHGLAYETLRKHLRHSLRNEFQAEVQELARSLLRQERAEELAQVMERHLLVTNNLSEHIVETLGLNQEPGDNLRMPTPDDADQAARLARVLIELFRLQRTMYGEPEQVVEQQGGGTVALGLRVIVDRAGEILTKNPEILDVLPEAETPVEPVERTAGRYCPTCGGSHGDGTGDCPGPPQEVTLGQPA